MPEGIGSFLSKHEIPGTYSTADYSTDGNGKQSLQSEICHTIRIILKDSTVTECTKIAAVVVIAAAAHAAECVQTVVLHGSYCTALHHMPLTTSNHSSAYVHILLSN